MKKEDCGHQESQCSGKMMAVRDTLDLLSGKWKLRIISALILNGQSRFGDLMREVDGVGAKMLSKELHDLEINQLITRTVKNTRPVTVEYSITTYGRSLQPVINAMVKWGEGHRKKLFGKNA